MSRFVEPGARVAAITGMLQAVDHREKINGFRESFSHFCQGGVVVDVIEGHESEEEVFQKCYSLLAKPGRLDGIYVSTVNCLPVCRAINAYGLSGKIRLITTDLFTEMVPYFEKGTIFASIYQRPFMQGQIAVQLLADHFAQNRPLPRTSFLEPQIVMRSNLYLFRETRKREQSASFSMNLDANGRDTAHPNTPHDLR